MHEPVRQQIGEKEFYYKTTIPSNKYIINFFLRYFEVKLNVGNNPVSSLIL